MLRTLYSFLLIIIIIIVVVSWKGLEEKGWKYILSPIVEAIMGLIFPVPPYPTLHSNIYTSHNIHADNIGINSIISSQIGSTWIHYLVLMKKRGGEWQEPSWSTESMFDKVQIFIKRVKYIYSFQPEPSQREHHLKNAVLTIDPRHGL